MTANPREIDALATLAVALRSELYALAAAADPARTVRFDVRFAHLGTGSADAYVAFVDTTIPTDRWFENPHVANQKSDSAANREIRLTSTSLMSLLPGLAHDLGRYEVVDSALTDPFCTGPQFEESHFRTATFDLDDALELLQIAVEHLVRLQCVGYVLADCPDGFLQAYIAVLAHATGGAPGEVVLDWRPLVNNFARRQHAARFPDLQRLRHEAGRRKMAGQRANRLQMVKGANNRTVTLLQPGADYFAACIAAAQAGQPMPPPPEA